MRKVNSKLVAVDLAECAIFVALMVAGTYIQIPFPLVPLTFQTVFAVLAGLLLGWKKGAIALSVYMIMGLIGIPVFSGGGGIYYVVKPSFGYIIGFIFSAAVSGMFYTKQKKLWQYILLALGGFLIDYIFGITYFIAVWQLTGKADLGKYIVSYNLAYMPKDVALCILAAVLAWKVVPIINKGRVKLSTPKLQPTQSENEE
jgi:biotin transport system substrate-specific component